MRKGGRDGKRVDHIRRGEREESKSQHDRGKPENENFTLRAPTSKALWAMPLHIFTFSGIQISDSVCVCEREREGGWARTGMREM